MGKARNHPARPKSGSNWLLDGLMIHGGYMPGTPGEDIQEVPITEGRAKRLSKLATRLWARGR